MSNRSALARLVLLLFSFAVCVSAQTGIFTYQGKLTDGGAPANGSFDLEFKLFDNGAGGVQQGAAVTLEDVAVANGVFTVQLDFGAGAFSGAARFLEIGVRPGASTGAFTLLTPRQPVQSTPYAIRSLNAGSADALSAACVGCVSSGQLGSVNGGSVTGAIPVASVPAGSDSYIQNTTTQQGTSNFNISGSGIAAGTLSANVVNAVTQYNLSNNRVLSIAGTENLFAGVGAGTANAAGVFNSFYGFNAGAANTDGFNNSFFGKRAGAANTASNNNSFFGADAGAVNTTGSGNSFFGSAAGAVNTTGGSNSFFGASAGAVNISGANNAFFGASTGDANTSGGQNSFFGAGAGGANTTGLNNSFFGQGTGRVNVDGASNSFFGKEAGEANTSGSNNAFFGQEAGNANTSGANNAFFGINAGNANTTGTSNTTLGANSDVANGTLDHATAIGADATVSASNTIVLGRSGGQDAVNVPGDLTVTGALTANGSGLTNLNAGNIAAGTLGVARGGTGLTSAGASGNYLRSNGMAWTSSALQVADIPTGSGNYIQNTTVQQPASNFNLSGNGTAGGTLSGNIVNATTQFNLNAQRILSNAGTDNLFAGVGAGAVTTGSSNAFLGRGAGDSNTTGSNNTFVGEGAGGGNTSGGGNTFIGTDAAATNTLGSNNTVLGNGTTLAGSNFSFATAIGAGAVVQGSNNVQLGRNGMDTVSIGTLASASATHVCLGLGNQLSSCSSSQRYKQNVRPLRSGLSLIQRLRPVTFDWKGRQEPDLGLIAEEVARVEPLLVTHNQTGAIEGVKYDQLSVVLINAVREQQAQIAAQQKQIEELQKLVCRTQRRAKACRPATH